MKLSELFDRWLRWLTGAQHNLRSFAVLRILFGVGLLFTVVPSIADRSMIWGAASFWVDPEAKRRGYFTFDLLLPKDNAILFDIVFFALIALILLFTIGYRTRIVTPILLILIVSLQSNNGFVLNGGDTLYRITLLFLVFANLSEHYSLDARRRSRRPGLPSPRRWGIPAYISNAAHNTALVLCCFQIIVVYVVSGVWKLTGEEWLGGTALFYALRIDAFMAYPAINELLWQSSLLIYIATFIALWVQTLFPLALLWRPTRIFVLVSLIFMHLGIAVLLGLWPFSLAMIALDMLFIRDSTWVWAGQWLRATRVGQFLEERLRMPAGKPVKVAVGDPSTSSGIG
ncbi:HTTM domain-containing protein [Microbacterium sp. A82]|uniref:HTTM domain-containing protein n=1 Tax=Microbacterium sp. A82 TaxID=3450452 RepID=UPI003F2A4F87